MKNSKSLWWGWGIGAGLLVGAGIAAIMLKGRRSEPNVVTDAISDLLSLCESASCKLESSAREIAS
ncbi:MAG: hypothetical protein JNM85_09570 [Chthonomonas sp.]|nr:hypothetical protein [Chthonomonas sp.]